MDFITLSKKYSAYLASANALPTAMEEQKQSSDVSKVNAEVLYGY